MKGKSGKNEYTSRDYDDNSILSALEFDRIKVASSDATVGKKRRLSWTRLFVSTCLLVLVLL